MITIINWNLNGIRSSLLWGPTKSNDWVPASDCVHSRDEASNDIFSLDERIQCFPSRQHQWWTYLQWSGDILPCFNECHSSEHSVTSSGDLTLCSLYVPPSLVSWFFSVWSRRPCQSGTPPIPTFGDFNAHHHSWGLNTCAPRGEMVVKICEDLNSVIPNNGSSTNLWPRNGSWSMLYLAFTTATIFDRFVWGIIPNLFESDHMHQWKLINENIINDTQGVANILVLYIRWCLWILLLLSRIPKAQNA